MKAQLFDSSGNKKSDVELPGVFSSVIREDLAAKLFEAEKEVQPYSPWKEAGKRHVASGTISHRRHKWKGAYGKGISRVPRKRMWRRGTQFYWIGAEVSSTRGGRRAHPPKGMHAPKKINKNEARLGMNSAIASTASKEHIVERYSSLKEMKIAPFIIESVPVKTKDVLSALRNIFGELFSLVLKNKVVRAGRGKTRGRKYKSNAGLLLVTSNDEDVRVNGIDVRRLNSLKIADIYPLGRLALYTKKAIQELEKGENKK